MLDGTVAEIASPEGKGITYIMNLANITRLHNIISSVGLMRRMIALVEDYSHKRTVFRKVLKDQPLHILSLSQMKFLFEGNLILMLELGRLQGNSETIANYKHNEILRLILPLAKLFTAKCAIEIGSEGMECFGGVGYMENSGIPIILRDGYVLSIWEGTTNVLSLDFLRVIQNHSDIMTSFFNLIKKRINKSREFLEGKDAVLQDILSKLSSNTQLINDIPTSRALSFL